MVNDSIQTGEHIIILSTVPTIEMAKLIAHALIKDKLVACANIIPGITSIYTWKGELHDDPELIMLMKTKKGLFQKVSDMIKQLHEYKCPEIISIPLIDGFKPYLDWIDEHTR